MKKRRCQLRVLSNKRLPGGKCFLLDLELPEDIPANALLPGQFVNILVENSPSAFLRRPISICFAENGVLRLLIRIAGKGTESLSRLRADDLLNVVLPLGTGFSLNHLQAGSKAILVGGGVGIAPLLYYGSCLSAGGVEVNYVLGFKTASEVILIDEFEKYGRVEVCTDDGTYGTPGLVTEAKSFSQVYDYMAVCGPTPMMRAVAEIAREKNVFCEVSLENMMACGVGACLCCVHKDSEDHNVCVCTLGPVFNADEIKI